MISFTSSSSSGVDGVPKHRSRRDAAWMVVVLLVVFCGVTLLVVLSGATQFVCMKNNRHTPLIEITSNYEFLNAVTCKAGTEFDPQACFTTFAGFPPLDIFKGVVKVLIGAVEQTLVGAYKMKSIAVTGLEQSALQDCMELLEATVDDLTQVLFKSFSYNDVHTFLSASFTNQESCKEGFANTNGILKALLMKDMMKITQLANHSLTMINTISQVAKPTNFHNRRLLFDHVQSEPEHGFPRWLSLADRTLLQAPPQSNITVDAIVALDGTGNFKSIAEAVNAAPDNYNNRRYVIYVKEGVYHENVVLNKNKTNFMFIGDGMDSTVITRNKSVMDGTTTYSSATFAVTGNGFIARDIGFENTAGPLKFQAVALRVGSDQSVFYRCSIKGYQDTLYVHSHRQFYKDCKIYGTVDFIFGNAAVVFQNCAILARKPLVNQFIVITAQGRTNAEHNTGISFHNCSITAAPDLAPVKHLFKAYLGRPWKEYSRTAFLHCYLDDIIRPEGWAPWDSSNFALDTLYYGEYLNSGPGARLADRVRWCGFHAINSYAEAKQFYMSELIEGNKRLPSN